MMAHAKNSVPALRLLLGLTALLGLWACGGGSVNENDVPISCKASSECPANQYCDDSKHCASLNVDGDVVVCDQSTDCPVGQVCLTHVCSVPTATDGDTGEKDDATDGDATSGDAESAETVQIGSLTAPTSLDYPPLTTGETQVETLTLAASADGPVIIRSVALTGNTSYDFTLLDQPPTLPYQLNAGATLSLHVQYKQSDLGYDSGAVEITSDALNAVANGGLTTVKLQVKQTGTPSLSCDPSSLEFGVVAMGGAPITKTLICTNVKTNATDDNTLEISSVVVEPAPNAHYHVDSSITNTLLIRTGHQASIPVVFQPMAVGDQTASLKLYHNANDVPSPYVVTLNGRGGERKLSVDRASVNFGQVRIGQSSRATITLTSSGDMPVHLTSIDRAVGTDSVFRADTGNLFTGGNQYTLDVGATATFDIVFSPTTRPSVSGTIEILSDASSSSVLRIQVSGSGTTFNVYGVPGALDFGPLSVGGTLNKNVTLTNGGTETVSFSSIDLVSSNDAFSLVSTSGISGAFSLTPGGTLPVVVGFAPTDEAVYAGSLSFPVNDGSGTTVTIPLTGEGGRPHLQLDPVDLSYAFGEGVLGQSATFAYKLSNTGAVPLTLSGMGWLSMAQDSYQTLSAALDGVAQVPADGSRTLTFTFAPPLTIPTSSLPLTVSRDYRFASDDVANPSVTLTIGGQAVAPYASVSPVGPYDFGANPVGYAATPIWVTVTNAGTGHLQVDGVQLTSDSDGSYTLASLPPFPVSLAAASLSPTPDTLMFRVMFTPRANGSFYGTLRILNHGYSAQTLTLSLAGKGAPCGSPELPDSHLCIDHCVANNDPAHCGLTSCTPCTAPAHATATCVYTTSYACGFACNAPYVLSADKQSCELPNIPSCCGENCTDCRGGALPEHGIAACNKTTGTCSFTCETGYHVSGDNSACAANTTPECCGSGCLDCTKLYDADMHVNARCNNGTCGYLCKGNYADCNGDMGDGCETPLLTDPNNCGGCGDICSVVTNGTRGCEAASCTVGTCNTNWGNCDNSIANGCETYLLTDVANCGACGNTCLTPNGTPRCSSGQCAIAACNGGYADCNATLSDGCEVNYRTDPKNCGSCGNACNLAHADPGCVAGQCTVNGCLGDYRNCDGQASNGCEVDISSSLTNCGACGTVCSYANGTPACVARQCVMLTCDQGYGNCDGLAANGCETNLAGDINNCGSCKHLCNFPNAGAQCSAGSCLMLACNTGFKDCNASSTDGCEVDVYNDITNCGACGHVCTVPPGTTGVACVSGSCKPTACLQGYGDCDGVLANGCIDLSTDVNNCGACGNTCAYGEVCMAGSCLVDHCDTGWGDCTSAPGCETQIATDPSNCGACAHACDLPDALDYYCANGICHAKTCETGKGDCDNIPENGCEHDVTSDVDNCGACGNVCSYPNGEGACVNGQCMLKDCDEGRGDCNGLLSDGCETSITGGNNTCTSATTMYKNDGSDHIGGDRYSDRTYDYTGHGESWFAIRVAEENSNWYEWPDLVAHVVLEVPAGLDYDLEVYKDSCNATPIRSSSGAGATESVCVTQGDNHLNSDDSFTLYIHVKFFAGGGCAPWKLYVLGHQGC